MYRLSGTTGKRPSENLPFDLCKMSESGADLPMGGTVPLSFASCLFHPDIAGQNACNTGQKKVS